MSRRPAARGVNVTRLLIAVAWLVLAVVTLGLLVRADQAGYLVPALLLALITWTGGIASDQLLRR